MRNDQEIEKDPERNERLFEDLWKRLFEQVLEPNASKLERIFANADVACVIYELAESACTAARILGWNGEEPVFRMSNRRRQLFADVLEQSYGDTATAQWLRRRRGGRIFLMAHGGTLCINFKPARGCEIEPGTLDGERFQQLY